MPQLDQRFLSDIKYALTALILCRAMITIVVLPNLMARKSVTEADTVREEKADGESERRGNRC